ncbi:MAG: hypothetical protein AAFP76_03125 [Bacteroidota bacterium]
MKQVGIWLDKKMAYIISLVDGGTQRVEIVLSKIEDYKVHGGSGTRLKGGPQDVVQDSKYLEREKHQFKRYFQEITTHLGEAEQIVLFGPAEAGQKLRSELALSYPEIAKNVKGLVRTDSMTKNQMKAFVRDYFYQSPGAKR